MLTQTNQSNIHIYTHTNSFASRMIWVKFINVRSKTRYVRNIFFEVEKQTHFDQKLFGVFFFIPKWRSIHHTCMYGYLNDKIEPKDIAKKKHIRTQKKK